MADPSAQGSVRSYVRRQGRLTAAQRRALQTLHRYRVPAGEARLDPLALFGRAAPLWLEIGFGNGDTLMHLASSRPELNLLGVEVHDPGIGHLLLELEKAAVDNVRVAAADARELLQGRIADASLHRILLLFPDPWPKKRHHKRRLLQAGFAALAARKLVPGGVLHVATDWDDYAQQALEVLEQCPLLENQAGPGRFATPPGYRIETRFERRGRRLGHAVHDLLFLAGAGEGARPPS